VVLSDRDAEALQSVISGLSLRQKALPGKYLWDQTGSAIFDQICGTEGYYLTRHDVALLQLKAREIATLVGPGATIAEFGSGASYKVRILLDAFAAPRRYLAIDISQEYLEAALHKLARDYPDVEVVPVVADYTKPLRLPLGYSAGPTLGFFPGSTIGNFDPSGVVAFLKRARDALGPSWFLIGADPNQDEASLRRAYGHASGLMANLHKNLLVHLNRLTGTDFDPDDFRHEVRIFSHPRRVEAHLVALRPVTVRVGDLSFRIAAGESIHTDTSYKLEPEEFRLLAAQAGWTMLRCWIDSAGLASLYLLRP
jgi:dimethylhistidine N-methyltransferase